MAGLGAAALMLLACGRQKPSPARKITVEPEIPTPGTVERAGVVPGSQTSLPADNPGEGGWRSEEWSAAIDAKLQTLCSALRSGEDFAAIADRLCASDFAGAKIAPQDRGESSPLGPGLQWISPGDEKKSLPTFSAGILDALAKAGLSPPLERASASVIGIEADGESRLSAVIKYQFAGRGKVDRRQLDGRWKTEWQLLDGQLLLSRISGAGGTLVSKLGGFSDITHAALGASVGFAEQFYRGQDHWAGQIEMHTGFDVGGWQGLSAGDVNGDGLDDLFVPQPGGLPNRLFVQRSNGQFSDRSVSAGVDFLDSCHAGLLADLDNDGDQDLAMGTSDGLLVLANDGVGGFEPRMARILPAAVPYSLSAADYDQDGDLDLYICCYNRRPGVNRHHLFARPVPYHDARNGGRNVLLSNEGEWRFVEVTASVGLDENNNRFSYAASWEDYDNDGDLDLYVANDFGRNSLYRNNGGKGRRVRFVDAAMASGVEDVGAGMSACWADYDNDGHPDLYVGNMYSSAGQRIAAQAQFQREGDTTIRSLFRRHARGNSLYRNTGSGKFTDVGELAGAQAGRWAWSSKFVDLDCDGYEDIVIANGFISQSDEGDL